jgi:UDP-N-acetylmuramyl pentapeptide synthase
VTPGLLELGKESNKIHEQIGTQIIGNADLVILVGKNERTSALELGINKQVKVIYTDKTLQFMELIKNLKLKKEPLVLLENDIPENNN